MRSYASRSQKLTRLQEIVRQTPAAHPDLAGLQQALTLVSSIATSFQTRLAAQSDTLYLLALQRAIVGSPVPIITPTRKILKSGWLSYVGNRKIEKRAFWLFNDALLYADPIGNWNGVGAVVGDFADVVSLSKKPAQGSSTLEAAAPFPRDRRTSLPNPSVHRASAMDSFEVSQNFIDISQGLHFSFRRLLDLRDITVIGSGVSVLGIDDGRTLQVLCSQESFAVFANSQAQKLQWVDAIRDAKGELLTTQRTQIPTSLSTNALVRSSSSMANFLPALSIGPPTAPTSPPPDQFGGANLMLPVMENYSAPVWVPDAMADKCMSCNNVFTMWRRKHHCRLCGNVVCHPCSSKVSVAPQMNLRRLIPPYRHF